MQQIAQLFLILLMGYAVVKTDLLKASDSKVLSVVFVYLVMPCVVLNAFQIKDTPEIRTGLLYSMGNIILNDVYLGDNTHIENCIVESRDTIRANSYHCGEDGIKIVVEKNERYAI